MRAFSRAAALTAVPSGCSARLVVAAASPHRARATRGASPGRMRKVAVAMADSAVGAGAISISSVDPATASRRRRKSCLLYTSRCV